MNAMLRLMAWLLAVALVALPVVAVLHGWIGAGRWPLTRLRATGAFERVDAARVRRTLLPYAQRGFFAVDLKAAQAAVAALPWVEQAQVRKRWPDVLEVTVTEHRPFARWGSDLLLSERGSLFDARGARVPAGLPLLDGPVARSRDVVELYQQSRELFAPVGMNVDAVRLDPRGSWSVTLLDRAHGNTPTQVLVGRSESQARIARFVRLLPQLLVNPQRHIAHADLRYTNGFALTWADQPAPADAPLPARSGTAASKPAPVAAPQPVQRVASPRPLADSTSLPHLPFLIPGSTT